MANNKFTETLKAARRVRFMHIYEAGTEKPIESIFTKNPVADFFKKYEGAKIVELGIYKYDVKGNKQVAVYIA